jgi:hypothetical protein
MQPPPAVRPPSPRSLGKWLLLGLEVMIAGVLILTLYQLQGAIFRNIATQLRSRTDIPVIYAVDTQCRDHDDDLSNTFIKDSTPRQACTNTATVSAIARGAPDVYLFVNGAFFSRVDNRSVNVVFRDIPLRRGFNSIEVFTGPLSPFPFVTHEFPPELVPRDTEFSLSGTGTIHKDPQPPNQVWLRWDGTSLQSSQEPSQTGSANDTSNARFLGVDAAADLAVFQGIPGLEFDPDKLIHGFTHLPGSPERTPRFDTDGFYVYHVEGLQSSATTASLNPHRPHRSLSLEFLDHDRLSVSSSACLDAAHPFVQWARDGELAGPGLILRLFNVMVFSDDLDIRKYPWSSSFPVGVKPGSDCTTLTTSFVLEQGQAYSNGVTLPYPEDSLSIKGADAKLKITGSRPHSQNGDIKMWNGLSRADAPARLPDLFPATWDNAPTPIQTRLDTDTTPFGTWQRLASTLPDALNLSTTAALPILLILAAMRREQYPAQFAESLTGPRAALVGVLAFVSVFALGHLVIAATRLVLAIDPFHFLTTQNVSYGSDSLPVPLAFIAIFCIKPLLEPAPSSDSPTHFPRSRVLAALVSILALAIALTILNVLRFTPAPVDSGFPAKEVSQLDRWFVETINAHPVSLSYPSLAALWLATCLFLLPFSVYWLLRAFVPRAPVAKAALTCSAFVFLLPALGCLSDFFAVRVLPQVTLSLEKGFTPSTAPALLEVPQNTYFAVPLIMFLAVIGLLSAFRAVLSRMVAPNLATRVKARTGFWVIALASAVILATIAPDSEQRVIDPAYKTFDLLWHFESYAPLFALIAVASVMQGYARTLAVEARGAFEPSRPMDLLVEAVFVGYLAIVWSDDSAGIVLVALAGWLSIRYFVLDRDYSVPVVPRSPELASHLVGYIERTRLLQQRRDKIEEKYIAGDLDTEKYDSAIKEIEALRRQAESELGVTEAVAKRALFALGPAATPLANAKLGGIAGLVAAIIVLLFSKLDIFGQFGKGQTTHLLSAMFGGGAHSEFPFGEPPNSPVLLFLHSLIQTVGPLMIAGGLFGYAFHRIRGRDGFTKALIFSAGCAIPFLIGLAMPAAHLAQGVQPLMALAPFALFFIVLGSLVFDGWTLHTLNVGFGKLIDLYGLKTSVGYASVAGLIAGVQPLLVIIDHLFPSGS